jgi:hypothetical protein
MKFRKYPIILLILINIMTITSMEYKDLLSKIANDQLLFYLEKIPVKLLPNYNLLNSRDFPNVIISEPYNLSNLNLEKLMDFNMNTDTLESILDQTEMWYFPVEFKGEYIAILILDNMNGKWKAVSFGYANLAKELFRIENVERTRKNQSISLIVNYKLKKYFFHISDENNGRNLTEIVFSNNQVEVLSDYNKLTNLDDTIEKMQRLLLK